MERRARLRLTGAMALALAATIALAQDVQEPGGKTKPKPDKPARAGGGKKVTIDKALEGMSLTEVQASQVTSLWNTYKQDMANWESGNAAAFKELKEKMKQAKEANDQDALKALSEEQAKLDAPGRARREELARQLKGVLTEEQVTSLLVAIRLRKPAKADGDKSKGASIEKALEKLALTQVQNAQVTALWNAYQKDMEDWQGQNAAAVRELYEKMAKAKQGGDSEALKALSEEQAKLNAPRQAKREELEKQFRAILPEEQTVSLLVALGLRKPPRLGEELHVLMARFHELKLTAEQEEKIKGAIQQAHTVIVAGILTPEQRDILKSPPSKPVKGGAKAPAVK